MESVEESEDECGAEEAKDRRNALQSNGKGPSRFQESVKGFAIMKAARTVPKKAVGTRACEQLRG